MARRSIDWQLDIEPGIGETTKYCPDCQKLRGISAFPVDPYTNRVTSPYCRVHKSRRNAPHKTKSNEQYEPDYQLAKNT
jgi:hypothetical protein